MRNKLNLYLLPGVGVLALILIFTLHRPAAQTVTIQITDEGFEPAEMEIAVGDAVRFVNDSTKPRWPASDPHPVHDFYPEFDPQRQLAPGESWEIIFERAGNWTYHDHLSPHRRGEVKVKGSTDIKADENAPELSALQNEKNPKAQAKIVHAMAEKYGPKQALELMKISGLPYTGETHLLVHEIGNVAYERYGDQALLYCDESFLSACFHGVVINALGDKGVEGVVAMLKTCKAADVHVLSQCSHAAGHGFLAYNNYKVFEALPYCDKLQEFDSAVPTFNCNDGVFMENIFGVHEGKPSPNRMVKAGDPYYPCNVTPDKYQPGCWANQATLMYQMYGDLRKVAIACDGVKNPEYQKICYNNFARQIHPLTLGKIDKAVELCQNATGKSWQDECLIVLVNAAFSVGDKKDLPYKLCASMTGSAKQSQCYDTLFNNIGSYAKARADLSQMCGYIKDRDKISQCEARFKVKARVSVAGAIVQKADIEKIRLLAKSDGAAAAYELLKKDWMTNQVGGHDLAHLVGSLAYEELGGAGFSICDNNFAFGCYHGLFEVLIKKEGSAGIENSRRACGSLSLEGRVASCLHGIGHGLMGSKGNVDKAVRDCETFPQADRIYCFDGAYMEYFNGIMREGTHPGLLENSWDFCLSAFEPSRDQCVRNQALFLLYANSGVVAPVVNACGQLAEGSFRSHCVLSVGLFGAQNSNQKPEAVVEICSNFPAEQDRWFCTWGGAKEFVFQGWSMTAARGLCKAAGDSKDRCLADIDAVAARYGRN